MKKTNVQAEKLTLAAQTRVLFGKKNRLLRRQGLLPANIFGSGFASQSISINYKDFSKIFRKSGETGIIYITTDKAEVPTLVKTIQRDPIESKLLHVDFRKVDLDKKIEAEVPLVFVGIAPAVNQGGVLINQTVKLIIEALPQDIPHQIDIDISGLTEIGKEIKVGDLKLSDAYTVKTAPENVIVSVTAHKEESIVAETTAAAAPEVLTAKPDEEAAEGETGEKKAAAPEAGAAKPAKEKKE